MGDSLSHLDDLLVFATVSRYPLSEVLPEVSVCSK